MGIETAIAAIISTIASSLPEIGIGAALEGAGIGTAAGFGTEVASGLLGAGVGAAGSAAMGGDPLKGAITGGLTGGLGSAFGGTTGALTGTLGETGADVAAGALAGTLGGALTGSKDIGLSALTGGAGGLAAGALGAFDAPAIGPDGVNLGAYANQEAQAATQAAAESSGASALNKIASSSVVNSPSSALGSIAGIVKPALSLAETALSAPSSQVPQIAQTTVPTTTTTQNKAPTTFGGLSPYALDYARFLGRM